ncbi:MAG: hypothetical protein K2N64_00045 [Anaeroplasmataceae bacterium]|nr:hypothetical protein [Anaeroplasmataceae bacterium]
MLKQYILENERRIEEFDSSYYLMQKNYPILAAISALETTNEIQKCYYELEDSTSQFNVLKLYAFLQSLFVSVDSLYALSYSLTKSKSTININKNQVLRELKYIRNDVVGHPANRMYNSTTLAYCILDEKSVSKHSFTYNIYSGAGVEKRDVDITRLVENYYLECNNFLKELQFVATTERKKSSYSKLSMEALNQFDMQGDYMEALIKLKKLYVKEFPHASSNQHRFLWRMELIEELRGYQTEDKDIADLKEYSIGLEILKIYQLFAGNKDSLELGRRKPILLSSFYRFLKKNKDSLSYLPQIQDLKNPYISTALNKFIHLAKEKNAHYVLQYVYLLMELYKNKEDALLYAFALPLKEYKK